MVYIPVEGKYILKFTLGREKQFQGYPGEGMGI